MVYRIDMLWNADSKTWVATSEDVPGLVLEAKSHKKLCDRLNTVISDIAGIRVDPRDILICDDLIWDIDQ